MPDTFRYASSLTQMFRAPEPGGTAIVGGNTLPFEHGDVIDETPMAYKDIDAVMAAQSDLVEIVHTLRQVVCVKG